MNPMHRRSNTDVVGAASTAAAASTWACTSGLAAHPMEVDSDPTHPFSLQPASHAQDEDMELGEELQSSGSGNTYFFINLSNA